MPERPPVSIDLRDPATTDPVALVTGHLGAGAAVTIHDSAGAVPTFTLARRGAALAVLDEAGAHLGTYADVRAALGFGLKRWPADLEAAADEMVAAAMQSRKGRRRLAGVIASLQERKKPCR